MVKLWWGKPLWWSRGGLEGATRTCIGQLHLNAKSLILGPTGVWGGIILHCGGCSVHCRMLSSISGLYLLDAIIIPLPAVVTTKKVFKHCQMSPGGYD